MRVVKLISGIEANTFERRVQETLLTLIKKSNGHHIAKLDIFVNSRSEEQFNEEYDFLVDSIKTEFKNKVPAHTVLHQPLLTDDEFVILAQMYEPSAYEVQYKTLLKHSYVTVKNENVLEVFSGAIVFKEDSLLFSAQRCFDFAEQILMAEDLNFGHIYRQWNYIPEITGVSEYDRSQRANLKIFNEIKDLFYEEALFTSGKPLNSNLNNLSDSLIIDFNAIQQQNNPTAPDFYKTVFDEKIEARIVNKECWYLAKPNTTPTTDVEKQTIEALKNIFSLKDSADVNFEQNADNFTFLKVFIKDGATESSVQTTVKEILPETDIVLIKSKTLPLNTIVEIEGLLSF